MTKQIAKLLACASQASDATSDLIEVVRDGTISPMDNVGSGETLTRLADATRLLIETMDDAEANQLHGALTKFLKDRT